MSAVTEQIADWQAFAKFVISRRASLGLSKSDAAGHTGLSLNGYRHIEEGRPVQVGTLIDLADALRVDPINLFGVLLGRDVVAEQLPSIGFAVWLRQEIATQIEAMVAHYPTDIFPEDSWSPDAVGARAMRHAYRTAAAIARARDEGRELDG